MDRIVSPADLPRCVLVDSEALACVRGLFTRLDQGRVAPASELRHGFAQPAGVLAASAAQVDGVYSVGLRVTGGHPGSTSEGRDGVLLASPETGELQALLLDDGYLRDLGLALAGAAAAHHLAPAEVETVAIVGADDRTLMHLEALALVREFSRIAVVGVGGGGGDGGFGGTSDSEDGAPDLPGALAEVAVEAAGPEALSQAQVILYAAREVPEDLEPEAIELAPGQHLWTSDANLPHPPAPAVEAADLVAAGDPPCSPLRGHLGGELIGLGRLTRGLHPGRTSPDQRSLFHGDALPMLDTALGWLAWRKSQKYKLGTVLSGA